MDVEGYIDRIERMVAEARPVPLSASVMVSRQELEEALAGLRAELPDELRQARWILKERDEVIEQARREGEQILSDARREADRLVSEDEIVERARRDAERIVADAREQAKVLRLEAEDYVDGKLANFEIVLQKTLHAVEKGRERLRGRSDVDDLAEDSGLDDPLGDQDEAAGQARAGDAEGRLYDHERGER